MKRMGWLLVIALAIGCSAHKDHSHTKSKSGEEDDHNHGPGPHKGLVVDFRGLKDTKGKILHFEFVMDHDKKEARVYILDTKAKSEHPIAAEKMMLTIKKPAFKLELKADNAKDGKASCFVGKDDRFGVKQDFAGSVMVELDGKQFTEDFEEKDHKH